VPERTTAAERDDWLDRHALEVGTWELDLTHGRFRASARWARMVGENVDTVGDSPEAWFSRIDERDRERVELELMTHLEGLSPVFDTEYRMKHRDGSLRWMCARGRAQRDPSGNASTVAGYQEDVTERREATEVLRRSEARFRALVENCPDAVAVHRSGRFIFANRRMLDLLGYENAPDLVGTLLLESIHPDDYAVVIEDVRALAGGAAEALPLREVRLLRRDGKAVVAELASLTLSFEGEPAIFAVVRDITDRKRLQTRLAHTERMASLGTLAAGVAHEINNPLTYVSANLQTMLEELPALSRKVQELRDRLEEMVGKKEATKLLGEMSEVLDPATFEQLLEQVQDALHGSMRVQSIVSDLKQFARIDESDRGPVDLRRVVEMALKMAGHEIKFRARVRQDFADAPPVLGDQGRLGQVFLNLLVNSAQAIEPGRVAENEISVSLRAAEGEVVAEVRDTGCGIPPENLRRIFDPFFTTKPPGVGSGLGLPICQHIVESYGGRIEVESEVGRGTCVRVRLPIYVAEAAADPGPPEAREDPPATPPAQARPRLLIVDDEPGVLRALQRALEPEYDVTVATGGKEAVAALSADSGYALVLCDVMMPDLSGPDVHAWARRTDPDLAQRIVFITGGATDEGAKAFLDGVENLVVEKPVDVRKLRALLRRLAAPPARRAEPLRTTAVPLVDRRRGRRLRARNISGVLAAQDMVGRLSVVDYSESGLRVSGANRWPDWDTGSTLSMMLHRSDPTDWVLANVKLVREARVEGRTDLCVQILSMDEESQHTYESWIAEDGGGAAGSRQQAG
jgi:PAS domain S-box-containing protein